MKRLRLALTLLLLAPGLARAGDWHEKLNPTTPGPFPPVRPFSGEFRFGWSGVEAARARAKISYAGDYMLVEVEGGTNGVARTMWQLDATHQAVILRQGLKPVYFYQFEKYAKKTVETQVAFKPDGLWRKREVLPDPTYRARWKKIRIEPLYDIISAMFFIRSQPLRDGDELGVAAYPGDTPFLANVKVLGREEIKVSGVKRKAIKLDFRLQRIVRDSDGTQHLEPHNKFRNGTVWLSDDDNRIPLRAEVNIFVGYIFGELADLKIGDATPVP